MRGSKKMAGIQDCCTKKIEFKDKKLKGGILQGIAYGLIPHTCCIAFIIGSVLGATLFIQFLKPLLLNRYFFHILILVSFLFATLSSFLYLRKNNLLSVDGVKRKWKYLISMYGSTVGTNILFFILIFPMLTNISTTSNNNLSITGATGVVGVGTDDNKNGFDPSTLRLLKLSVDIPCPGHAPLISNELKSISGVIDVKFSFPNVFEVKYDSTKTSKQKILSLAVFDSFPATVFSDSSIGSNNHQVYTNTRTTGTANAVGGCGCCGGGVRGTVNK
ncbi:MAG: hypothetical protein QW641_02720 [Candidatus Aenigmatarchaeota archaeon]